MSLRRLPGLCMRQVRQQQVLHKRWMEHGREGGRSPASLWGLSTAAPPPRAQLPLSTSEPRSRLPLVLTPGRGAGEPDVRYTGSHMSSLCHLPEIVGHWRNPGGFEHN